MPAISKHDGRRLTAVARHTRNAKRKRRNRERIVRATRRLERDLAKQHGHTITDIALLSVEEFTSDDYGRAI